MVSSVISAGKPSKRGETSRGKPSRKETPDDASNSYTTLYLTIFVFRGHPFDYWYRRHVLLYFTSPDDPEFHETVHVQREDEESDWIVDQIHVRIQWDMTVSYLSHVNAGSILVNRGQEMVPVNVVAATPVNKDEPDWNCQHFMYEGLQGIVRGGFQTQEWYDLVAGELDDRIVDGAIG